MAAFAKMKNVDKCEEVMKMADAKGLQVSKHMYTTLIVAHAKTGRAEDAERILMEMEAAGLERDAVTYTAVIEAYKRKRNITKVICLRQPCSAGNYLSSTRKA